MKIDSMRRVFVWAACDRVTGGKCNTTKKKLIAAKIIADAPKKWYASAIYHRRSTYALRQQYLSIPGTACSSVRR
jgi:hypothetical protein